MSTSVVEIIDLSQEVFKTKCNIAKLMDRNNALIMDLDKICAPKRLVCDSVQNVEAPVKVLKHHVDASDLKHLKTVKDAAQIEKELHMRFTSCQSALQAEKNHVARFGEARVDEIAKHWNVSVERQKARDALKNQLREKEETLRQILVKLTVASSKLENCASEQRRPKESYRLPERMYRCRQCCERRAENNWTKGLWS